MLCYPLNLWSLWLFHSPFFLDWKPPGDEKLKNWWAPQRGRSGPSCVWKPLLGQPSHLPSPQDLFLLPVRASFDTGLKFQEHELIICIILQILDVDYNYNIR